VRSCSVVGATVRRRTRNLQLLLTDPRLVRVLLRSCLFVLTVVPFDQQMFSLHENTSGTPTPIFGCTLGAAADGCANRQSVSHSSDDHDKYKPSASITTPTRKIQLGFVFRPTRAYKLPYTDPSNSLFDAVSPQPLYSFGAAHTHVFSQNLVNYFNPAFCWYESVFGPSNLQWTRSRFRLCCRAPEPTRLRPSEALTTPGFKAGALLLFRQRQSRLEPWRSRTAVRNQYPYLPFERLRFREGTVPTVTQANLQQFISGVALQDCLPSAVAGVWWRCKA
jgi:hypothetical protein